MTLTADERSAIERLKKATDLGTVIPVIGAGVSRQALDLPDWRGLLESGLKWCEAHAADLNLQPADLQRITSGVNLDAPSLACFELWANTAFSRATYDAHWKHPLYAAWLEQLFGRVPAGRPEIYDALATMEPRVVITTNYDTLLQRELMPDSDVVTWDKPQAIANLFREGRGVFHLHGVYDRPDSVVLTSRDYERVAQHDMRSRVAQLITTHSILLFVGVSVAGATDRHLATLLRMAQPKEIDAPLAPRNHILLHRGRLAPAEVARLKEYNIQPLSYGDEFSDLPSFFYNVAGSRNIHRRALSFLGLGDEDTGEPLMQSRWLPERCLKRVQRTLRFMGLRSSKWVQDPDTRQAFDRLLHILDHGRTSSVRFLILNPDSESYRKLERMRNRKLSTSHLRSLARLDRTHPSLEIRCVDFITAFRLTAVDDRDVGLALYATDPQSFNDSEYGWRAEHFTLNAASPWTLARSLLFTFDQQFESARPLREIRPGLYEARQRD
jgi:hypothetical protein